MPTDKHVYPRHKVMMITCKGTTGMFSKMKTDLERLIPHNKKESKFNTALPVSALMEVIRLRTCDHALYWEMRQRTELILWATSYPKGPTVKFQVANLLTSDRMRYQGNFHRFTRPILSFSHEFDQPEKYELRIIKELMKRIFATPHLHHKSVPFVDHVIAFRVREDGISIDFRVYSIQKNTNIKQGADQYSLAETGPSFVLIPFQILSSVMCGDILWRNENYVSPGERAKQQRAREFKQQQQKLREKEIYNQRDKTLPVDPIDLALSREGFEEVYGKISTVDIYGGHDGKYFMAPKRPPQPTNEIDEVDEISEDEGEGEGELEEELDDEEYTDEDKDEDSSQSSKE